MHKWRSEEASILVGTNTAFLDDPSLTTRLLEGNSPVRLVVDLRLELPSSLKIFNKEVKTIVFNNIKNEEADNLIYYKIKEDVNLVRQVVDALYQLKIQSVMVEGGAKLLQSFINEGMWDEVRTISNQQLTIGKGLQAPEFTATNKIKELNFLSDKIEIYRSLKSVMI